MSETGGLEYRVTPQGGDGAGANVSSVGTILRGYAIRWDSPSVELESGRHGVFREVIKRGATLNSLQRDIRILYHHDDQNLLGRTSSRTLKLGEDQQGLWFILDTPDTSLGRDMMELVRRGDLRGMSFGFSISPGDDEWTRDNTGGKLRTVRRLNLYEISIVGTPAYPSSNVQASRQYARSLLPYYWRLDVIFDDLQRDLAIQELTYAK